MNGRAGCLHVSGARLRISASLFAGSMSLVRDINERKGRVFACQRSQAKNICQLVCRKQEPLVRDIYERKGRVFACQRRQTKNTCEQICRKHEPGVLELVSPRNGAPCQGAWLCEVVKTQDWVALGDEFGRSASAVLNPPAAAPSPHGMNTAAWSSGMKHHQSSSME
eukprot:1137620-Pelagomonas_calceolata.AAC.1